MHLGLCLFNGLIRRDDSRNAALIVPGIRIVWILNNSTIFYPISGYRREFINSRNAYIDYKGGQEPPGRDIRPVVDTSNFLSRGSAIPGAGIGVRERKIR